MSDVTVVTTDEEHIHTFDPWRGEYIPRAGDSVWVDGARWRVVHVIHAPLDADVTLFVDPEPNTHDPPRALAGRSDGDGE